MLRELALAAVVWLAAAPPAAAYSSPWLRAARCIRWQESRDEWHLRDGAYQIIPSTWRHFAPASFPRSAGTARPAQQTLVAWRVYVANGRRWGGNQWPNSSRACGVR